MTRCWIEGESLDDLLISTHSATAAGHETHTRIPGATLLGAAAAALYKSLTPDDAWTVFHSGAFRFGDLRPMHRGLASVPVPLSWWREKGASVEDASGRLDPLAIRDLSVHGPAAVPGTTAIRSGYVTRHGDWVRPRTRDHLKSARDPATRRARDRFLFGSEGIVAGTMFGGWLSWDDRMPERLVDQVRRVFADHCTIRVGRSRSAEFGRLRLAVADESSAAPPDSTDPQGGVVPILLLSDLQLDDPRHGPTLRPVTELLGLPEGRLVEERCHVTARRYRPFNGHRRRPDLARTVFQAGSVLVFEFRSPLAPGVARTLSQRQIGSNVQDGLGEILVAPAMMSAANPRFSAASPTRESAAASPSVRPATLEDPLARWALDRSTARRASAAAIDVGDETADEVVALLRRELEEDIRSHRLERWPPSSQWKRLQAMAERAGSESELIELVDEVMAVGVSRRQWQREFWTTTGVASLADLIGKAIATGSLDRRRSVLRRVAVRMGRWLDELSTREDASDSCTPADGGNAL